MYMYFLRQTFCAFIDFQLYSVPNSVRVIEALDTIFKINFLLEPLAYLESLDFKKVSVNFPFHGTLQNGQPRNAGREFDKLYNCMARLPNMANDIYLGIYAAINSIFPYFSVQ